MYCLTRIKGSLPFRFAGEALANLSIRRFPSGSERTPLSWLWY